MRKTLQWLGERLFLAVCLCAIVAITLTMAPEVEYDKDVVETVSLIPW